MQWFNPFQNTQELLFNLITISLRHFNLVSDLSIAESALLKVTNGQRLAADAGDYAILILLDLNASFDTVDDILIERLKHNVGLQGIAFNQFLLPQSKDLFSEYWQPSLLRLHHLCGPSRLHLGAYLYALT